MDRRRKIQTLTLMLQTAVLVLQLTNLAGILRERKK